jgi:uncharacterized protein YndB with AHSA1/START domain
MPATTTPRLALTRIFNAPRALVYQAFTDQLEFDSGAVAMRYEPRR